MGVLILDEEEDAGAGGELKISSHRSDPSAISKRCP